MNSLEKIVALVKNEPVRVVAVIQSTLVLGHLLEWWHLSNTQINGLVLVIAAWLGIVTRRQVTPV